VPMVIPVRAPALCAKLYAGGGGSGLLVSVADMMWTCGGTYN
jgi:hypothetical protein